jgi:spore germination protein YaaH
MPAKHGTVSVFLPPLTTEPTDVPGGDAFDVASLSSVADRFRLMTLDYSANSSAGPTIDTGWAVDAYRFAASRTSLPIDVSLPLYGTDFSDLGERSVTYLEAMGAAATFGAPVSRGPTGAPHVAYTDADGHAHDVWFDDAYSTILELDALGPSTLPPAVGVTFYGLGAEDPALFSSLAARLP